MRAAELQVAAQSARVGVAVTDLYPAISLLGSIVWPYGNQIFALEAVPSEVATGLPLAAGAPRDDARALFYGFMTRVREETP